MSKRIVFFIILALVGLPLFSGTAPEAADIRVTILYDNYAATEGTQADWGFSCLLEGAQKTILLDAGARGDILQRNVKSLGVDLSKVELVVLSHLHGDHSGGLEWALSQMRSVPVYLPAMAGDDYLEKVRQWGGEPVRVREPREICSRVYTTGEMPADFDPAFTEQAIVFQTAKGLVVITGCAHPGILAVVRRAPQVAAGVPVVVLGGLHLMNKQAGEVSSIITEMKAAGVERCGASHCTGDRAITLFKEAFGNRFLSLGVGRVLTFSWKNPLADEGTGPERQRRAPGAAFLLRLLPV